jgi:hypothetical protein
VRNKRREKRENGQRLGDLHDRSTGI